MNIIGVIPARYESSRFPGKPLAEIKGKPMIFWVYHQSVKVKDFSAVYVATDDERIREACQPFGINVVMTQKSHLTGTDRVGEVAGKIPADIYVNIQGDEPLLEPETIQAAIKPFYGNPKLQITNLMTPIHNPVDVSNSTVPKVITNKDGMGVYLTRAVAPYPKGKLDYYYYKQVCVYGYKKEALDFFCKYGKKYGKARVEAIEDIEIMRFIENGYAVQYVEVDTKSVAVDTPVDLERVRKLFDGTKDYD